MDVLRLLLSRGLSLVFAKSLRRKAGISETRLEDLALEVLERLRYDPHANGSEYIE